MDSTGGFHMKEKDGKPYQLEYYHPKYHPIQQTQSSISSYGEPTSHEQPFHSLFLCPTARSEKKNLRTLSLYPLPLDSSPEYILSKQGGYDHHVLPLYWCNNKEFDVDGTCEICCVSKSGTYYYFCVYHGKKYHKECVESPVKLKTPYHPEHSLQLFYTNYLSPRNINCFGCGRYPSRYLVYYCTICQFFMHPTCAMKPITFVIDQPKRHDHPLTLFPRQTSLTCNICGLLEKLYPTYVCLRCNFVAHKDCMYFPHIIKISRHHHRISYISFLPSKELYCGVCRQSIDTDYGAYTCEKCSDYVVHSRCALGKDVWDGKELEGVIEKDDITQDASSFDMICDGVILHFLHDHHLRLEVSILYDENKLCQACVLPIYEGNFYSCMECEFILHETCVMAPRRIQHALHPHPLTLKNVSGYDSCFFRCNACDRICSGFVYECHIGECNFNLDVRCASISEPFDYKAHAHPLFLALDPIQKPTCHVCKTKCHKQLNCTKCDFIVCIKCATLPAKARCKYDKHFLKVSFGEETCEKDWCEMCESELGDTNTKAFYRCNECCSSFHIDCLFGRDPYMKPGQNFKVNRRDVQVLVKSSSRPFCDCCKNRCQSKIFKGYYDIVCSIRCLFDISYFF